MAGVSLHNVSKSFGAQAVLCEVSLDIAEGEFLTLLGPSGCGKSTLLRIIAGLEQQSDGSVAIGGRPVDHLRPKQRDVAMVFQSYALYPHLSVGQNLALPLRMRRLTALQRLPLLGRFLPGTRAIGAVIAAETLQTARTLEIDHLLDRKPGQLSGGQRQRVALGRAMVRQPMVFLMDEPLSNLDAKLRVHMRAEIVDLHRRLGATFIYVTHDQAEAMTMSDRVAVMLDGELLQVAAPQEIYEDPANRRIAEFVGSPKINMIAGQVHRPGVVDVQGVRVSIASSLPTGTKVTLGIRPEALDVMHQAGIDTLPGRVRLREHLGSDIFFHVDIAGLGDPVVARMSPLDGGSIAPNDSIHLRIPQEHVMLFGESGERLRESAADLAVLRGWV